MGFFPSAFPWISDFGSLWALCKLMDVKGVLSAVGVGQGEGQGGWIQGCTHLLPSCLAHNRAAGAFCHFRFFSVQLLNPGFCFVQYCSFTFHCKLFTCRTRHRKFVENTELLVRRLRRDEQIPVLEVISSVSYAPVQTEHMSLAWHVGAKRENNGYELHPRANPKLIPLRIKQTKQCLYASNGWKTL